MNKALENICDVYESMSIYKSVLVHNLKEDEWELLKAGLVTRDFPLITSGEDCAKGRVHCVRCTDWHAVIQEQSVDWGTISVIICLGEEASSFVQSLQDIPNYILTINI